MQEMSARFEETSGHTVRLSSGSTGKLYAQIVNGAPFDIFFAADTERPELLDSKRVTIAGSRFNYALGRLALWGPRQSTVSRASLRTAPFRHLAIASPKLAPYGAAAKQALENLELWGQITDRVVTGENVSQTYQFVYTGNAEFGFVAYTQLAGAAKKHTYWLVPAELHAPLVHTAVMLKDSGAARDFMSFTRSAPAREIIAAHGYDLPPVK